MLTVPMAAFFSMVWGTWHYWEIKIVNYMSTHCRCRNKVATEQSRHVEQYLWSLWELKSSQSWNQKGPKLLPVSLVFHWELWHTGFYGELRDTTCIVSMVCVNSVPIHTSERLVPRIYRGDLFLRIGKKNNSHGQPQLNCKWDVWRRFENTILLWPNVQPCFPLVQKSMHKAQQPPG